MLCPQIEGHLDSSLVSILGSKMAWFLDRCEMTHPELSSEPLSSALKEACEIVEVVSFCRNRGLKHPIDRLAAASSNASPAVCIRTRFLKKKYRVKSRLIKRRVLISSPSFCRLLYERLEDLPFDLSHLGGGESEYGKAWRSRHEIFKSVACNFLSSKACELAGDLSSSFMGFPRVSMRLAAMVLCKRTGVTPDRGPYGNKVLDARGGAFSVSTEVVEVFSGSAPNSVVSSETVLSGHPAFDHHVAVCAPAGKIFLGERDGLFYLISEDYSS